MDVNAGQEENNYSQGCMKNKSWLGMKEDVFPTQQNDEAINKINILF